MKLSQSHKYRKSMYIPRDFQRVKVKVRHHKMILNIAGETMDLSERQEKIIEIVKENGPITGEKIAEQLHLSRATLRPDLAILTMAGFLDARPRVGYFYTGKTGS